LRTNFGKQLFTVEIVRKDNACSLSVVKIVYYTPTVGRQILWRGNLLKGHSPQDFRGQRFF
jgi:hypothetical protein